MFDVSTETWTPTSVQLAAETDRKSERLKELAAEMLAAVKEESHDD
ncbi:MAG TPA: hypothetical protein PKH03_05000 [Syntrophales bacterium]|nr:hypothetical protein [Syntrophales bacterium]